MSEMNQRSEPSDVRRLPLWRSACEKLLKEGVAYGQTIPAEWFETELSCKRDSMHFGLGVSKIRRQLEKSGFYLSGRGQKGNQFVILPPSSNANVMENYGCAASDALKRGVILGTNTRLDSLTAEERRKHEAILERMAIKAVLLQRSGAVENLTRKHAPKLLSKSNQAKNAAA